MTDLFEALEYFHFLRPWWLALVPAALLVWWRIRSLATANQDPPAGLAPHLAAALTVGGGAVGRLLAIDAIAATLMLISLAAAGPTWSRLPNPLVAQTAPLAVAVEVSESMLQADVAPSRLERAKHKILDLIAKRAGARTALFAYAGTAHRVVPFTEDPDVLKPFIEGLSPEIMPSPGQNAGAALNLTQAAMAAEETPGAILFVVDSLDRADLTAFQAHTAEGGSPIVFLSLGTDEAALSGLEAVPGAALVQVTPDSGDVAEIERRVASAFREALARDDRQAWEDRGWILVWPAAFLAMFWFRRGWTMRWCLAVVALVSLTPSGPARAEGIAGWFLTPDQQGRLALEDKDYAAASALFENPMWRGYALYRAGKYAEAATLFAGLASDQAAFAQGLAHVKGRDYRAGITAFETALDRNPDHAGAARNLEIARAILAYVEKVREQSDFGEEGGVGADDVVFDKESEGGTDTRVTGDMKAKMQTAEQWMRTVDTRTADFLRIRFSLEASRRDQ